MFYKIQQGLVGISLPSEVCSLTRASQAPNVFPFRYIQSSCNVCSIVAGNTLLARNYQSLINLPPRTT